MTEGAFSRRRMLGAAALGVPALALSGLAAEAYQGNMERALSALGAAMESLQAATPNKGGHRERAMRLIGRDRRSPGRNRFRLRARRGRLLTPRPIQGAVAIDRRG